MIDAPKGNRIWLVCTAHTDTDNGIMLGERRLTSYFKAPTHKEMEDWFDRHAACDPNPDHYRLAHDKTPNWDVPVTTEPDSNVGLAVKLALLKS